MGNSMNIRCITCNENNTSLDLFEKVDDNKQSFAIVHLPWYARRREENLQTAFPKMSRFVLSLDDPGYNHLVYKDIYHTVYYKSIEWLSFDGSNIPFIHSHPRFVIINGFTITMSTDNMTYFNRYQCNVTNTTTSLYSVEIEYSLHSKLQFYYYINNENHKHIVSCESKLSYNSIEAPQECYIKLYMDNESISLIPTLMNILLCFKVMNSKMKATSRIPKKLKKHYAVKYRM